MKKGILAAQQGLIKVSKNIYSDKGNNYYNTSDNIITDKTKESNVWNMLPTAEVSAEVPYMSESPEGDINVYDEKTKKNRLATPYEQELYKKQNRSREVKFNDEVNKYIDYVISPAKGALQTFEIPSNVVAEGLNYAVNGKFDAKRLIPEAFGKTFDTKTNFTGRTTSDIVGFGKEDKEGIRHADTWWGKGLNAGMDIATDPLSYAGVGAMKNLAVQGEKALLREITTKGLKVSEKKLNTLLTKELERTLQQGIKGKDAVKFAVADVGKNELVAKLKNVNDINYKNINFNDAKQKLDNIIYRGLYIDDDIRNLPKFKGKTDNDILEIMATTIPGNTGTARKRMFNQTLNFGEDKLSAIEHIYKFTNPKNFLRIADKTDFSKGNGIRYVVGVERYNFKFKEPNFISDFWKYSKNETNDLPLDFLNGENVYRTEGINVITGNFPQFIGKEGETVGRLHSIENVNNFKLPKKEVRASNTLKNIFKAMQKQSVKPTFKSEIDWAKWNKEIPQNKELLKEYHEIEQTTKVNGTWMKNPDGSEFIGEPEEFIKIQSKNFKKAFLDGYLETYKGVDNLSNNILKHLKNNSNIVRNDIKNAVFTGNKDLAQGYGNELLKLAAKKSKNNIEFDAMSNYWNNIPLSRINGANKSIIKRQINKELTDVNLKIKELDNIKFNGNESVPFGNGKIDKNGVKLIKNQMNNLKKDLENKLSTLDNSMKMNNSDVYNKMQSKLGRRTSTDDIAKYVEDNNLDNAIINNIRDNELGTDIIVNHKSGNYLKDILHNNGIFDMSNPNIYKTITGATTIYGASKIQGKQSGGMVKDKKTPLLQNGEVINSKYQQMFDKSKQILEDNKNINWVQRAFNPYKVKPLKSKEGDMTHYMSYWTNNKGENIVSPYVVEKHGKLVKLNDKQAKDYSKLYGINVGNDNEFADFFSSTGYKMHFPEDVFNESFIDYLKKQGEGVSDIVEVEKKGGLLKPQSLIQGKQSGGKAYLNYTDNVNKNYTFVDDINAPEYKEYKRQLNSYNIAKNLDFNKKYKNEIINDNYVEKQYKNKNVAFVFSGNYPEDVIISEFPVSPGRRSTYAVIKPTYKVFAKGTPEYDNAKKQEEIGVIVDGIWGDKSQEAWDKVHPEKEVAVEPTVEVVNSPEPTGTSKYSKKDNHGTWTLYNGDGSVNKTSMTFAQTIGFERRESGYEYENGNINYNK